MTGPSVQSARLTQVAAAICVVVVFARIVLALVTPAPELVEDAAGYHLAAQRLVQHGYYAYVHPEVPVRNPAPNALVLPGYTVFLAALYKLFGSDPQPLVSIVQALVSGLSMWGVFLLTRRMAGAGAGLSATVLMAVYPPFWWSYRYVLTEEVFTALAVWTALALAVAYQEPQGRRRTAIWAAVGALAVASTLVRAVGGVWVLAAGLALLAVSAGERPRILRGGLIAAAVAVALIAPWWIRNAAIYDAFVPLNTKFAGTELTHLVEDREQLGRLVAPFEPTYVDAKADYERQAGLAELTDRLRAEALREDATGYVMGRVRATAISLFTYHPNPFMGFRGWGAVTEAVHLAVLILAGLGVWLVRRDRRVWILLALPVVLVALHAPTLIFSRYLYPAMPIAIAFAGVALAHRLPGSR